MQVLLTAATPFEIAPTIAWLEKNFEQKSPGCFSKGDFEVRLNVTGVGIMATTWHMASALARDKPDLVINAGIAGAIDRQLKLGDVVHIVSEQLADLGVEDAAGQFTDLFDLGMQQPDDFPFSKGQLLNPKADKADFLPKVNGITVNKVHGSFMSIQNMREKYPDAQVESMEGAAFFYACLQTGYFFVAMRAISNYVEPRNREAWDISLAIKNLNLVLVQLLGSL